MAESKGTRNSSVRNLPPGKMNNIRKMFESGNVSDPEKLQQISEEIGKTPKPIPRQKPPGLATAKPAPATKPALPKGQKPQLKEKNYAESKVQANGKLVKKELPTLKVPTSSSAASTSPSSASANSSTSATPPVYALPKKKVSPTVSRRINALQTAVGSDKENEKVKPPLPSSPPRHVGKSQPLHPPTRTGSRNSDPEVSVVPRVRTKSREQIEQEKLRRKSEPNSPKKTLSGNDEDVFLVSQRMKKFESQPSEEDGNSPKKTNVIRPVRRQNSIGTARELTHSPLHAGVSPFNFRGSPALPNVPPPSNEKPELSAPPPPRKPPRTHAHDDYLKTKVKKNKEVVILEDETNGNSNVKTTVKIVNNAVNKAKQNGKVMHQVTKPVPKETQIPQETDTEYASIKDRISKLQKPSAQVHEDAVKKREPPSRPPLPKQRPFSVATDHMISKSQPNTPLRRVQAKKKPKLETIINDEMEEEDDPSRGHMVLSMVDELTTKPVQRYPLRKSFSSDDLHRAGLKTGDPVYMDPTEVLDFRDDTYEVFVDDSGYAVPNKFVKRRLGEKSSLDPSVMSGRPISQALKAKFVGFRKIFASDQAGVKEKQSTQEQDPTKVNHRKMNQIKQKLNQSFGALQKYVRSEQEPIPEETEEKQKDWDTLSVDSDFVEVSEIQRRVQYVSTVKARTKRSIKKTKEFLSKIYPQLFEYALVVGLRPLSGNAGYKPYIIHKFPETVDSNVSVPVFCFPDANEYKPSSSSSSESYSFVLTNIDGERVYGYCRRIKPPDSSLHEVLCIISPVDALNMYNKLLDEIEKFRMTSIDLAQELIAASFGRPMPGPGKVVHIRTLDVQGEMETFFLNRPADSRRENVHYDSLLNYLGTDKLIKVFSSLMMERRVLLCSKSLSCLTQTLHALVALLYPFCWQHIYIPLLPPDMLDVCASPTPYLIGILKSHLPQVLQEEDMLEEVMIVDLDKKQFVRSLGDESTILPKKLQKALKTAINMCKLDRDLESSQCLMVAEAFMRMFIEIMGHFGEFIVTQSNGQKKFEKEKFVCCVNAKGIQQVLEWFSETQMFEVFITNQLEKREWGTIELFMKRLMEYKNEDFQDTRVGFGQKVKNIGKALKTKLS